MPSDQALYNQLKELFAAYAQQQAIEVIALATTDGFPVYSINRGKAHFAEDTLAAAASTLHSVSNAVSQQILSKHFKVAFIEAEQGNVAFVSLTLNTQEYVLAMSAGAALNIASLRLLITRLANEIQSRYLTNTDTPVSATIP